MQEVDDNALLRQYVENRSDEAFAALVTRQVNLVYSVAFRQTGNPHHAEEITQAVFIILAKKADRLRHHKAISSWLFQVTRLTANNFVRSEIRRHRREQEAHMQSVLNEPDDENIWTKLGPLLDAGVAGLGEKDRRAIVLRFYEGRNYREVGLALGAGEDAAEKRVSRALEKLRHYFTSRGVVATTAIIAVAISANSVQAAPAGLAKAATAVAVTKGAAASGSTLTLIKGALKIMAWTKAKVVIVVGVGVLLAAGTTTMAVREIQAHGTYRGSWQVKEVTLDMSILDRMPPLVQILPTKFGQFKTVKDGIGIRVGQGDRVAGLRQPVSEIVRIAYGGSLRTRLVGEAALPREEYDFVATGPGNPKEALQQEIRNKFGLVAKLETRETNVLVLRVKEANAKGLRPSSGKAPSGFGGVGHISVVNDTLSPLDSFLEQEFFEVPVIDRTGLDARFDYEVVWDVPKNGRQLNLDGLKQALADQLGLELVPGREPVEMLVVEKAKDGE